jgi:cytoskeleton protein RodZ
MPDHTNSDASYLALDNTVNLAASAGASLKAAREAAGVQLAVLSVTLKVPMRQLEALEADQYPADQSPVFVRALAASVCRKLRIDSAPILALMPLSTTDLQPADIARHIDTVPVGLRRASMFSLARPARAGWIALGMLLLIAALIWVPSYSQWPSLQKLMANVTAPDGATIAPVNVSTAASEVLVSVSSPTWTEWPAQPSAQAGQAAALPVSPDISGTAQTAALPTVSSAPWRAASVPAQAIPTAAAPIGELVFNASNSSWIEVREGQAQLLWRGVLNAGESKRLNPTQAVSVVIGRAEAVQVSFRGQAVDLKPHTQATVARFEVKP